MRGFVKRLDRHGIECWLGYVVDFNTNETVAEAMFLSENAARAWAIKYVTKENNHA